jgi:hypothetical protein
MISRLIEPIAVAVKAVDTDLADHESDAGLVEATIHRGPMRGEER